MFATVYAGFLWRGLFDVAHSQTSVQRNREVGSTLYDLVPHYLLLSSLHSADSVAWNPHKSLHVPLQCSAFLTRHGNVLQAMLSVHAQYLFQKDKLLYDTTLDTGDMSLQCGRLNDALKIWLMWKKTVRLALLVNCPTVCT